MMMSDEQEDGFLSRWSRRKREAKAEPKTKPAEVPDEEFDLSTLPSLETLDAASDYAAFMKQGVPKALRLAALRKAWTTDPAITGYKTLADYDWDCNAQGYGRLLSIDDPKKAVEAMFRHLRTPEEEKPVEEKPPAPEPESLQIAAPSPDPVPAPEPVAVADQEPEPVPTRRRHGGAVPT
jgi:hypothetical protein